jgi:two-component system phosphate regulon sensor histidine kinase PhoR
METLLTEARAEADSLRKRVKRLEKIILSTRLIMGHEIKKPTTAIGGYLDLAAEDLESTEELATLAYVKKAREECKYLAELTEFYLELLKVDAEDDYLGREAVDIATLILEVIDQMPPETKARERVKLRVRDQVGPVEFDPDALRLIFVNLIENALLYSQKNTPVRVEVEQLSEKRGLREGGYICVRVKDDGVGIPKEYLKKIFNPFVRLREDIAEGSGLGLTLARSLAELNGGEVSIRSAPGAGTTVYLTIPVDRGEPGGSPDAV